MPLERKIRMNRKENCLEKSKNPPNRLLRHNAGYWLEWFVSKEMPISDFKQDWKHFFGAVPVSKGVIPRCGSEKVLHQSTSLPVQALDFLSFGAVIQQVKSLH